MALGWSHQHSLSPYFCNALVSWEKTHTHESKTKLDIVNEVVSHLAQSRSLCSQCKMQTADLTMPIRT